MIQNAFSRLQDWIDGHLRRMCGRITPEKRLAVILAMLFLFSGLSIYIVVSSIYRIGKEDGQALRIEHLQQLQLPTKSSNNLNYSDDGTTDRD